MKRIHFLSANLHSHGKMKLHCVKACKHGSILFKYTSTNTSQHESTRINTSQHESTQVRHESTLIKMSPTRVNTN